MISRLDPPWVESQEITFDPQNPRHVELAKSFENLEEPWQVVESRYFLSTERRPTWDAVRHFVEGKLDEQGHFKKVFDGGNRFTTIIFASGLVRKEYIAVAMDYEPIEGKWLLGYFSLKK